MVRFLGCIRNVECLKARNHSKLRKTGGTSALMVSKVTVKSGKYTNILMGTVQAAIAHSVLDAVRAGDIPKDKVNDLDRGKPGHSALGGENRGAWKQGRG